MLEPYIFLECVKRKGSISAEHGIGVMKAPYLSLAKSPEYIATMAAIKKVLDPNGIMCPYKMLK